MVQSALYDCRVFAGILEREFTTVVGVALRIAFIFRKQPRRKIDPFNVPKS